MKKKIVLIPLFLLIIVLGYFYYENSKVQVTDLLAGIGPAVQIGQTVVFDYRAFLKDSSAPKSLGVEFDSSYRRQSPTQAQLGSKQLIPGLEKAILGMSAGGQRLVEIDSSMAYGNSGAASGMVPPKATVIYLIELRSFQ